MPRFGNLVVFALLLVAGLAFSATQAQTPLQLNPSGGQELPPPYPVTGETLPPPITQPVPGSEELLPIATPADVIEPPAVHWYSPRYWIQPGGWDTGIELGLNGSSGTSESMSLRAGGYIKRENDARKLNLDLYHNRTHAGGVATQNNARFNARHDWLMGDSPWTIYALSQVYYDEFQAFDLNVNADAGLGYRFIKTEALNLTGTIGSGATREFGGDPDRWVPEAQYGLEYDHKLAPNQRFVAKVDYFPSWEDYSVFRMLTDIGWEIELLQPSNLSLKIAATDRYDSDPNGAEPHNLNYSVLLLWKL